MVHTTVTGLCVFKLNVISNIFKWQCQTNQSHFLAFRLLTKVMLINTVHVTYTYSKANMNYFLDILHVLCE